MSDVSSTGNSGGLPDIPHYHAQYKVSPEFRKYWEKLFPRAVLSDKQIQQMTDQFVKQVSDDMNRVLNWALKEQKKREREREKDED